MNRANEKKRFIQLDQFGYVYRSFVRSFGRSRVHEIIDDEYREINRESSNLILLLFWCFVDD